MSDLSRIEQDINEVRLTAKAAVDNFNGYHQSVADEIKHILVKAGIFDKIAELETARNSAHQKLTEDLKVLQVKVDELLKIHEYLLKGSAAPAVKATAVQTPPVAVKTSTAKAAKKKAR